MCLSASLEIGDDVGSVFGVGNAREGHGVTRGETGGALEPLVQISVRPLDGRLGGQGARVCEALARGDVLTWQTAQGRSHRM